MSQIQFINAVKNGAISGWHKHKILPSISIAQAILESGWGGSDLSKAPNYNLFGIKASEDWAGEVVNMPTQEWSQSKGYYWIRANFRKYNSWDESIEDHGSFFTNTPWRKQNYARVIGEKDYKVAAKMLRECGYATDINYPTKLINLIDAYNLTQYDRIAFEGGITNTTTPPTNTMSPDYYLRKTVGDSLSSGSEATAKHIDVTFIGDSLLVGTEPKLKRFKWKKANYNAKGSRQWTHSDEAYNAIAQLKTMLANNQVHSYVVFILGTNRGVTADEIKQAVDLCGVGRKILLVDTLSEVAHREAVAQAYKQASEQYSNVFYGDWSRYSKLRMDDNYYKDGPNGERIHMTPIGYERHANFIMHALYQMYNYGNTSGTPKNMRSVADIEYDDGIFTSPIGETIIYNKKLNDQFSFKSKKGNVLWIEKVVQTDKDDPQEAIAEGVAYMKEHAHPAVHYTVKLNELPDTVSIGDTGIFIDHEFNPPLAIEARILNITTSETNPNANTVTIGNVKELFPQSKEDILALQQQLQATREELLTQAYLDDVYEVKIESSNGLALAGGAEGFGKDLIERVEGNTFYLRHPKSLSNGFKIKGKIDDKHLINRHDGLVADSLTNQIDFNPDYENPQGSDTAYPLKPFDSHELEVSEFTATFYDESGGPISTYKVPIYLDGNFNLPLKFEKTPRTMKITSDMDITFDYILVFEEYLSVEEDETTELTARVFKNGVEITDEIDHFTWTKVSSDGREDEGWKDLNKFNQTNKITIKASDLKDFESRFNVKAFDKRIEELIASNGVTIKNQISPALAEAKAEAERMDAEIKKEIDTVLDRFDTERTETEQRINEALDSAKAEAERLDNERQLIIDGKFEEVNNANETLEQSIATAEQNAQDALTKAGASEDLAKTAKEVSDNALSQFQTTSQELSEAKATAEETLQNAINALSGANSVITQSQALLDNAESAKTEASQLLTTAQQQLAESGVISGDITTFKNEVNNAIKGYVTKSTYDSNNATLNTRLTEWEKTAEGITTSISEVEGKVDNLQIGGRNLIPNTGTLAGYQYFDGQWYKGLAVASATPPENSYLDVFSATTISEATDDEYVVSFYAKATKNTGIFCFWYSPNTTTSSESSTGYTGTSPDGMSMVEITTEWKRYWVKWKQSETNTRKNLILGRSGTTVSIAGVMLEAGNIPSDWTPAPEDNVSQSEYAIYKNETEEKVEGFTRTVSAYEQDVTGYKNQVAVFKQTVDGYEAEVAKQTETVSGLTTEVASYKQAVDGYSSELSKNTTATNGYKSEVAGYKQKVDGYGSKLTQYTQSNDTLTAKVNDYEATVDGYEQSLTRVEGKIDSGISSWNLLRNTDFETGSEYYSPSGNHKFSIFGGINYKYFDYKSYKIVSNGAGGSGNNIQTSLVNRYPIGTKYRIGFWARAIRATVNPVLHIELWGGGGVDITLPNNPEWNYYTATIEKKGELANSSVDYLYFWLKQDSEIAISRLMLTKGEIDSEWAPSQDEYVNQNSFATYQNKVKSTTDEHSRQLTALTEDGGRISKVEQKADSIQTSLSSYAKTAYVDTQITNKAGEINTNLTRIEGKFDNLQIGGRNLYLGGDGSDVKHYPYTYHVSGNKTIGSDEQLPSKYFMRINNFSITGVSPSFYFSPFSNSQFSESIVGTTLMMSMYMRGNVPFVFDGRVNVGTNWTKVSFPYSFGSSNTHFYIRDTTVKTVDISSIKFEKGNIATDWSPAPEDMATKTEFQTVKETTNLYERTIGTTETNIKSNIAKITMSDSLFQTEVSKSIDVGGRNYFSNYNGEEISVSNNTSSERYIFPSNDNSSRNIELEPNTTYTMSAWFRTNVQTSRTLDMFFVHSPVSGAVQHKSTSYPLTTEYRKRTFTFTTGDNPSQRGYARFDLNGSNETNTVTMFMKLAKLEKGNITTDWSPAPEDKANQSQVTQLSNSWALSLKSGNDIKTAINATTDGIRLKGNLITLDGQVNMTSSFIVPEGNIGNLSAQKITSGTIDSARIDAKTIVTNGLQANVVKSEHILADNALFTKLFTNDLATQKLATKQAWIKTSMIGDAQIGTAQIGQIDASNGKIINLDAQYITANHARLVSAGFQGLNSNMFIDGGAIRIQNNEGDFATMNAIPEFRSQDSLGTAAIMGKGRSQYYSNNQSRFYIGSSLNGDEYNGSVVHGVHISKNQTWGIYRQSDAFGGTPAQYFKTPAGWGAVQVIEELMRTGKIVNNFTQASAMIRGLNGWGNSFPVLQPGDMVMYQAAVPGNSSGIERIWTMGTSSNGTTRTYSHVHHVFEGGTTGVSDARLKHDIKPTDIKALDHIADLSFKQFRWNRNDELEPLGLIAQESGILRVPDEEMEGIDIQRAMMLALKGIQELSQKVQELEA